MYLREMGTVPLLTREGEIELAKRNERGQWAVRKALSRSPLVIREIIQLGEELRTRDGIALRTSWCCPSSLSPTRTFPDELDDLLQKIDEIEKHYKRSQQFRQKLQAISRSLKPKQHRGIRYALARSMVQISRIIRNVQFSTMMRRSLADRLRCAVDELKPLEREIAKIQRRIEEPTNGHHPPRDLRKELRQCNQRIQQIEEECGASVHGAAPHAANRRARRVRRRRRQEAADRGQPAPGGFDRQALHQSRPAVPGSDPGRQHRPDEGGGQVRLSPRL